MSGCYDESRWGKGERPGSYKIHDYVTGDGIGSAPEDVAEDIKSLCSEIADVPTEKALTAAAYMHLMNYYLMINGLPPTVIYEEDKRTYYMELAVYDKSEEISGFVEFVKEQTIKTWTKASKPVKNLSAFL